jgi:hypothetical protein
MGYTVYGCTIKTRLSATDANYNNSTLGIVNGVIQLVQNPVAGLSGWKTGILDTNGIGTCTRSINVEDGGNIADPGQCSITLNNAGNIYGSYQAANVYLNGCVFTLVVFNNSTTPTPLWKGRCKEPDASTVQVKIEIEGLRNGRVSQLLSFINLSDFPYVTADKVGTYIPACFGNIPKAKFIRTANAILPFTILGYNGASFGNTPVDEWTYLSNEVYPTDQHIFYLSARVDYLGPSGTDANLPYTYSVQIAPSQYGLAWSGPPLTYSPLDYPWTVNGLIGLYMRVVKGTDTAGKSHAGESRLIIDATVQSEATSNIIYITLAAPFAGALNVGTPSVTDTSIAWVVLEDHENVFKSDIWPCFSYT